MIEELIYFPKEITMIAGWSIQTAFKIDENNAYPKI